MEITESVILSETKNLMLSMRYKTLHSVQGDTPRAFARASIFIFYRGLTTKQKTDDEEKSFAEKN